MKNKIIIIGITITLIGMICTLMTKNKNFEIEYKDETNTYIIKKHNKKIIVKYEEQVICTETPCKPIIKKQTINFEKEKMNKINELFDKKFKNKKTKKIIIAKEQLSKEDQLIIESIIKNDETILNKEKIYIITTDTRLMTMKTDGGSNYNIYYKLDKENNTIKKLEDHYIGFKGYEYKEKLIYEKTLEQQKTNELVDLLDELIEKEDIKTENNHQSYKIELNKKEKYIYNKDSINELKNILKRIDEIN